jgi:hypothetical protein
VKDDFCTHDLKCNASAGVPTDIAAVTAIVNEYKDHPAVLMWYTNDELGPTWLPQLEGHQQLIQALDYNHPTWSVLYEAAEINMYGFPRDYTETCSILVRCFLFSLPHPLNSSELWHPSLRRYIDTCDTIGTDPYPVPDHNVSMVRDWANDTRRLLGGTKAIFEVIQAHNNKNYGHATGRTPTFNETRSMVWQAIAEGANGIFYYSYFDIERNPDVPFETQWGRLSTVSKEVSSFAPCLLSDDGPAPPVDNGAAWLVTRERWCDPSTVEMSTAHANASAAYVVFAVSDGSGGGDTAFTLPPHMGTIATISVVNESPARSIKPAVGGGGWSDTIDTLAVRVYSVTLTR